MHPFITIGTKGMILLSIFLIVVNLVGLYFIIVLYGYDEIVGYLDNGIEISLNLRYLTLVFFLISVVNLLFFSISIMAKLISSEKT